MPRVLLVVPSLGYQGSARQAALLSAGLPRDQVQLKVCALGRDGPLGDPLRAAGVEVETLDWTRPLDMLPLFRWRELVRRYQPELMHAWGMPAVRLVRLLPAGSRCRVGVSAPGLAPKRQRSAALSLLDRRLLRRAAWATYSSAPEKSMWNQLGVSGPRLVEVPPGVAIPAEIPGNGWPAEVPGLPAKARVIVCVGALRPGRGFRDAIWALDMLKFIYDDLHMVLIGDGPDRERLAQFAADIQATDRVHFVGWQPHVTEWLARAALVWVPSLKECGHNIVLEAMAVGRPIVASSLPGLAELVRDGESGLLAPPGDKPMLARQTRLLLEDPPLAQRLGTAARSRAAEHFSARTLVERFLCLYHNDPG